MGKFLNRDEAPWNSLMTASVVYAIPPLMIDYLFRGSMSDDPTMGGVAG